MNWRGAVLVAACVALGPGCDRSAPANSLHIVTQADSSIADVRLDGLSFTTPVPAGVVVRLDTVGASISLRYSLQSEPRATIQVLAHPPGADETEVRQLLETFVASRGIPVSEREQRAIPRSEDGIPPDDGSHGISNFPWAVLQLPFATQCVQTAGPSCELGYAVLGRHDERLFQMMLQTPPNAWGALLQAAKQIATGWRWADGRTLAGGG